MMIAEQQCLLMRRITQRRHSVSSEVAASARQVVAIARELLGGNGVVADFLVRADASPSRSIVCSKPGNFRMHMWEACDVQPVALAGGQGSSATWRPSSHMRAPST